MFKQPQVVGHWHTLIEGFSTSSLDFYGLVKAGIARREIPNLTVSHVVWQESGLGSGKRVYLRVSREALGGDLLAIAGAVTFAGYLLVGRRVRSRYGAAGYSLPVYLVVAVVSARRGRLREARGMSEQG